MASATSTNFLAKWDISLLNEAGDSLRIKNDYELRGEDFADGGWGNPEFLSHYEFLKRAQNSKKVTVVCKVGFKYIFLQQN
jgi:hypothetical protein